MQIIIVQKNDREIVEIPAHRAKELEKTTVKFQQNGREIKIVDTLSKDRTKEVKK